MALPAVTGTVMRTGLLGQACACDCASTTPGAASRSDRAARKARRMDRLNWGLFWPRGPRIRDRTMRIRRAARKFERPGVIADYAGAWLPPGQSGLTGSRFPVSRLELSFAVAGNYDRDVNRAGRLNDRRAGVSRQRRTGMSHSAGWN